MKSVMDHNFAQVPRAEIPRSSFNRSHGVKTTFDAGYLIPFFCDEVLPGDTFNLRSSGFARLSTPLYPVMDNMYLDTFYFYVPLRLLWDNFVKMMGEQTNPGDSTDFICPEVTGIGVSGYPENSLFDYFGVPTSVPDLNVNAFFFRAYNMIWNEWFRDQNLQDSIPQNTGDGPDDAVDYFIKKRGKRHDYFTSCLPWPQKGAQVLLPLGDSAPVTGIGKETGVYLSAVNVYQTDGVGQDTYTNAQYIDNGGTGADRFWVEQDPNNIGYPNIRADLSNASASTINELREAFQVQKMYERDARGGTRYVEMVQSHFGVTSPDARLQRPEFLGGGSSPINVTPIAQTSETGTTPQGSLAGIGTSSFSGHGFTKSFTEHGVVIGIANVRADITYQQGLNRMFSRSDRLDFYFPALAHIGEQAVLNKEIFAQGTAVDDAVFGYQERFGDYRYKPSTIHGSFRSSSVAPLDAWHLSQDFSSLPVLSSAFIEDDPPIDRVIATPSEPHIIADFYHDLTCVRPMPLFGTPGNIDRF